METAIEQFMSMYIAVFLVIGWIGIAVALSALGVLIYRIIKMVLSK